MHLKQRKKSFYRKCRKINISKLLLVTHNHKPKRNERDISQFAPEFHQILKFVPKLWTQRIKQVKQLKLLKHKSYKQRRRISHHRQRWQIRVSESAGPKIGFPGIVKSDEQITAAININKIKMQSDLVGLQLD